MLFSSSVFLLLFLPIVFILYYIPFRNNRTYRNALLLAASLFFYAWGEPVFVLLLIASIVINWCIGLAMDASSRKKTWLIIAVVWNIALMFVFKYLTFVLSNADALFGSSLASRVNISLPLGISFFTFQILSYIFDLYYGKTSVQKKLYKFALYVSMFPQLVAGPIVRYEQIVYEIDNRHENMEDFSMGMTRFVYGLGKKVIYSNCMGTIADNLFYLSAQGDVSVAAAWIGAVAYTLQIYFDFSGYSDMAIGLGRMFGFHFLENFNYPYMANSITDFWRRWHISLSTWFRDYVYIPLGGNRHGVRRTYINTFVVWLLTGIWHGANWTFIAWGLLYFVLLTAERLAGRTAGTKIIGRIYTLIAVTVLWVIFRADSLTLALRYIGQMLGSGGALWDDTAAEVISGGGVMLLAAAVFSLPVVRAAADAMHLPETTRKNIAAVAALPLLILCISKCLSSAYNPFIYFNF
jgi:D-alanyl-lipoteichoic acid acyltransferase DltB (MBOAT superfamily)